MLRPALAHRAAALAAAGVLIFAAAVPPATAASPAAWNPNTDGPAATATTDATSVIVRFDGDPLATSTAVDRAANKQVRFDGTRTKALRATLAALRHDFRNWLKTNAPKAKITGEYDFALNGVAVRLNGTDPAVLRTAPRVAYVGSQNTYTKAADSEDPDLAQIDALKGWRAADAASSRSNPSTWAGYGIQVGVIDSGIDLNHPCFSDGGFGNPPQYGDARFTNHKVIAARVFNNKLNQSGLTPKAVDSHGTHVAGTIACNLRTPAVLDGVDIPYAPSGVAPGAQLGNYNVFPGTVANARTEDILNAMQAAAEDGMDVINMSLGGDAHGTQDLATLAVDNLDKAGIVVAVSAGNEGPGAATISSPGSAERALTAGASSVGHFIGIPINAENKPLTRAATGEFAIPSADLSAPLAVVIDGSALSQACSGVPAGSLDHKIALLSRGGCTFGTKVYRAEQAGAVAVVVVNNVPGDPVAMATDPVFSSTIPAAMASLADKDQLTKLDGTTITLGATREYTRSYNDYILAGFSSRGPVDVTYRVKPDVVAPGVNVLSSIPLANCPGQDSCWAFMQGTSMAAPHLAGMAAVVRAAHPSWLAWQVRSAIVNTADADGVIQTSDPNQAETDVQQVGSGLGDLEHAVGATVALSSPSISLGAIPRGSGKAASTTVTLVNLGDAPVTLPLRVQDPTGSGSFSVAPSTLTLPAAGSASVTVSFKAAKGAPVGPSQARLEISTLAHAPLYAYNK